MLYPAELQAQKIDSHSKKNKKSYKRVERTTFFSPKLMLYPAELQAQKVPSVYNISGNL